MINRDFKSFDKKKQLFGKKKSAKKPLLVATLAVAGLVSAYQFLGDTDTPSVPEAQPQALALLSSSATESEQASNELTTNPSETAGELTLALDTAQETTDPNSAKNAKAAETANSKAAAQTDMLTSLTVADLDIALNSKAPEWQTVKVKKGDTLAKIFKRQGYSASDLHYLMRSGDEIKVLKSIRPGHTIEFVKADSEPKAGFQAMRYPYSMSETLVVNKTGDKQFNASIEQKEISYQSRFATATINSSFYNAGVDAGLPDGVIMELAGVFEYDIDFALEIRKGDSFSVLYQEKYIDGKKVGYGDILSAEFSNQGDKYAAVQYTDEKGRTAYYTPEGKALRKSFLRAPLKFNYVSSNFNPRRFHPIQKRVKPHRGVDYRAATGTPVRASGDGRVIRSQYDKYNGHHVFVQHGNNIVTKYLHFSKRKVKKGQRVKQGQIIGYVGSTGMSQAPHLHYEFVVNGVHRNPRTVKLPHAAPVRKAELARFKEQTKGLMAQLETQRTEHFARLNLNPETTKLKQ